MVRAGSTGVLSVRATGRNWEELVGVTGVGPAGAVLEKQINDKRKARGEEWSISSLLITFLGALPWGGAGKG